MIGSRISTTFRVTLGLVSLTLCLLLTSEFLGLLPDQTEAKLNARGKAVEIIAAQVATAASRNDSRMIQTILSTAVERNDEILSAALRRADGLHGRAGDHENIWEPPEDATSTSTHVQVPIMREQSLWGTVEIRFRELQSPASFSTWTQSTLGLMVFMALVGFGLYYLFLRRVLRELDPSSVVPEHVRSAFDALAEGVIIIDEEERIVLANREFAKMVGKPADMLSGYKACELDWLASQSAESNVEFPWQTAMREGKAHTGVSLRRQSAEENVRVYVVNGAPIVDAKGKMRGALATFDDVSDLEKKNEELEYANVHLSKTREEVKRQNKELRYLATRDPLTGLLNRRALFERFEKAFDAAKESNIRVSAIMTDIDHFKSVNDKYGHSAGDKVIKFVAKKIMAAARVEDLPSRYGGEEFCVILPGMGLDEAAEIAEKIRLTISEDFDEHFSASFDLSVSLGVATLEGKNDTPTDLLNRADMALYAAKENGRNRTVRSDDPLMKSASKQTNSDEAPAMASTQLIEKVAHDETTMRMSVLSDRVIELDTMIEEKSAHLHRKHGFDDLTGLPTRILFYDRLSQALETAQAEGQTTAVLYLDIDLLRRNDDVLGPINDDDLLRAAADRLQEIMRHKDMADILGQGHESTTIARLGGNEFGIAINELAHIEAVTWIIQGIFEAFATPIDGEGGEIYANSSVGVSLYPTDGDDPESLVRSASVARHHAHAAVGHNQFRFFSENMNERSFEQMQMQSQLRDALEREEFELYYQPEIDVETEQTVAMEALIRWHHPKMGMIGPDMFIPVAEYSGLIDPIGDWVLKEACHQMKDWLNAGIDGVRVAVNLSAVQVQSDRLVDRVLGALEEADLEPEYLELEVTETALMRNVNKIDEILQKLRFEGVNIAIDDFGTGYSSLSHLRTLVVDRLKIDRMFTRDVTADGADTALVGAIIAMAHSMGVRVVAEGVETEAQLDYLRERKCDVAQGYLLSRPVPADEASILLGYKTGLFPALKPLEGDQSGSATIIEKEFPEKPTAPVVTEVVATGEEKA